MISDDIEALERGLEFFKALNESKEMNTDELIDALDQRYGNPHAKECHLIQEAVKVLRLQADEIKALHKQMQEKNDG